MEGNWERIGVMSRREKELENSERGKGTRDRKMKENVKKKSDKHNK